MVYLINVLLNISTYRPITQIFNFAHKMNGAADESSKIWWHRSIKVRSGTWRWPFLQEIRSKVTQTGNSATLNHNNEYYIKSQPPYKIEIEKAMQASLRKKIIWIGIPILLPHQLHKVLPFRKYVAWFWLPHRGSFVKISNFWKFDVTMKKKLKNSHLSKI